MGRAKKPDAAKLYATSIAAMDNTTVSSETTADVLDVRSHVTRSSKRKEGKDIPESSNLSGSKKISVEESEKEAPLVENLSSKPSSDYQSFEKKIDSILEYVQEITSKSEEDKELSYKSKYLDSRSQYLESQNMVEALTKENQELNKKLESAHGKLYAYEQTKDAFGQMKEMLLVSNMAKATEALVNFTSQITSANVPLPQATTATPNAIATTATPNATVTTATPNATATTATPIAPLPQATTGVGIDNIAAAAPAQIVSIPQEMSTEQGTTTTIDSDEPQLGRGKRLKKIKGEV